MSNKSKMTVAVLLECIKVTDNPWITKKWQGLGVVPFVSTEQTKEIIATHKDSKTYRFSGFELEFNLDELESYYQNLIADNASIFIICNQDEDENPLPFLVTLSYHEAAVYLETDEVVFNLAINPEIYKEIEDFVLENYEPPKFKKRKRVAGGALGIPEQRGKK